MPTPPYSSTWIAGDGDWTDAGDWSTYDPSTGMDEPEVPGADNDVSLPSNSGGAYTVTYDTTDTIWSLGTVANATLDMTGGSLTVDYGGVVSGTIDLAAGATLSEAAGSTLVIDNGDYSGALTGGGDIEFQFGSSTIDTNEITVTTWELGVSGNGTVSTTTLDVAVTYSGDFLLDNYSGNNAILDLNGETLTLTSSASLYGAINGAGTVDVTGTADISAAIGGDATIVDAGSMTQVGLGYANGVSLDGTLQINAGATYTIDTGNISNNGATIVNDGTLTDDESGTAYVDATFTNSGTLSVASGDTLNISGTDTFEGSVTGAGTLLIGFGAQAALDTTNVTVGEIAFNGGNGGGTTTLDVNLSYAGIFDFDNEFGALDLNGMTLTLSGDSNSLFAGLIDGGGAIDVTGAAQLNGVTVGSGSTGTNITDGGSLTQTGGVDLDGTITVESSATYTIDGGNFTDNGATFVNDGTLADDESGTAYLEATFTNSGTLSVASGDTLDINGTDTFEGSVTGAGTLLIGFGAQAALDTTNVTVGEIVIDGGNGGGTTTLDVHLSYGGIFDFSNQFGTLDLNGKTLTLSGDSDSLFGGTIDGGGAIDVTGAAQISATVGSGSAGTKITDAGSLTQTGNVDLDGTITVEKKATYTIDGGNLTDNGATFVNNGTLADDESGTAYVEATFTNSGTLSVASGDTLDVNGTDTFGGSLTGAGTLLIGFGAQAALDTTNITVSEIVIAGGNGGGTTTLDVRLSYGGIFDFSNQFGTLDLNGETLTLSGDSDSLFGGTIDGGGAIDVTGAAQISATVGSGSTGTNITDAGSLTQTGNVNLDGTITVEKKATYTIDGGNLTDNGATFVNNGTLADDASAYIGATFTNSGTLSVASGDTLDINGTDTFGGSITGAGTLLIGFGAQAALDTTNVTVGGIEIFGGNGGGTTTLDVNLSYAGIFDFSSQFGTLDLNDETLTLSGDSNSLFGTIDGGGAIDVKGAAQIAATVGSGSTGTSIMDGGSLTQTGGVSLDGTLTIQKSATYTIDSGGISGSAPTIVNDGTFIGDDAGATLSVSGTFTNDGSVEAENGNLYFNSQVLGTGTETIDAGASLQLTSTSSAKQTIDFDGSTAELYLNDAVGFHSKIDGFDGGGTIDLIGFNDSSTYKFTHNSTGGTLTVTDGSDIATFKLYGDFKTSGFALGSGSNGELLTYAPPA
jgi:fibronectin-binding autotransporter adhesin